MKNQVANTRISIIRIEEDGRRKRTLTFDQVIPYSFLDQELAIEKIEAVSYSLIDSQTSLFGDSVTDYVVEAEIERWELEPEQGTYRLPTSEESSRLDLTLQHSENGLEVKISKATGILA